MNRQELLTKLTTAIQLGSKEKLISSCEKLAEYVLQLNLSKALEAIDSVCDLIHYNNYLSAEEADLITASMVNYDSTTGPRWTYLTFINAIQSYGKATEDPYFNEYALYVTANKFASDLGGVISKIATESEDFTKICYDLAVALLKDDDKPQWIRWYFNL